jgi:hypothetical protein
MGTGQSKYPEYWLQSTVIHISCNTGLPQGLTVEVQIKARSRDVASGYAALSAAIPHELRNNYWFVFYSERLATTWIMTSSQFIAESNQNKNGKNAGLRSVWFNGKRKNKKTGGYDEYIYPRFQRFHTKSSHDRN